MSLMESASAHDRLREVEELIHADKPNIFMVLTDVPDNLTQMGIISPICYVKSLGGQAKQRFTEIKSKLIPGSQSELGYIIFGNSLKSLFKGSLDFIDKFVFSAVWQRIRFEFEEKNRALTSAQVIKALSLLFDVGTLSEHLKQEITATVSAARQKARLKTNGCTVEIELNVDKEVEAILIGQLFAAKVELTGIQETCDLIRTIYPSWLSG